MQKQAPDSSGIESCGRPLNVDERANKNARERPSDVATSDFMQKVAENVSRAQSQQQRERELQEPESPGQHIEIICHPEDTQVPTCYRSIFLLFLVVFVYACAVLTKCSISKQVSGTGKDAVLVKSSD